MMKTITQVVIAGEIIPAGTDVTGRDIPSGPWLEAAPVESSVEPVEADQVEVEPVAKSRSKRG